MYYFKKLIHICGGKIILDEKNMCNKLLEDIDKYLKTEEKLSDEEINFQKGWLLKMINRVKRNDIEGNFR